MARYKIPYTGLNDSLKHLRVQIIDSLPYTVRNLPKFETPEEVFNFCKENFKYKSDPVGIELFQSVPTLLENNGQGDCDCATIFCIAMLLNSGFTNCGIVLTGRNKLTASHIYAYNINHKDEKQFLDLTNKNFNQIRFYPFSQCIPFKISKNQLNMFLQLADNGLHARRRQPQMINKLTTEKNRNLKKLNKETNKNALIRFATTEKNRNVNKGKKAFRIIKGSAQHSAFMPSKNVHIPFTSLDRLPINEVKNTLLSEGYEVEQLSEYLSGRAERKARRAQKMANKQTKFENKQDKKKAKTEVIRARAEKKKAKAEKRRAEGEAKKMRAEAKRIRAEGGEEEGGMKIFNKAGEFVKNIVSKRGGEDEEQTDENPEGSEGEDQEQQPEENENENENQELEEGNISFSKSDWLSLAVFGAGIFLEKTKRV